MPGSWKRSLTYLAISQQGKKVLPLQMSACLIKASRAQAAGKLRVNICCHCRNLDFRELDMAEFWAENRAPQHAFLSAA